ncbi:sorbosone dehydrogenase family protein [bacterium]|nr:sorbosone dehydrogenase family protein [bacterium]
MTNIKNYYRLGGGLIAACTLAFSACVGAVDADDLSKLRLPEGFSVEIAAPDVPNARSMTRSDNGIVYVGTRKDGRVWGLRDGDGDGSFEQRWRIDKGLEMPNGVAWRGGHLYVVTNERVLRYDDIDDNLTKPPKPTVVFDGLPDGDHHGWRYAAFGPDGWLYIALGARCNVCEETGLAGQIVRMQPDGSNLQSYAKGVRNSVGFTWHPDDGALWFTDNGRDWMGDDLPPCELNRATDKGQHFGFPYCHGGFVTDPEFDGRPCSAFVAPVQPLGPHVAPLGLKFYTGEQFPAAYRNQVLLAEHGSWNRSEKIGYRLMQLRLDDAQNAVAYEPFVTGWLQGEKAWGRPVDVLVEPDGSLLVSDDVGAVIYRIRYTATAVAKR